ncbi:MAG: GNAT family N-acetyltransferase [Myxococcales bacterium]|nr:GNAT family N-acetyltransferase [Myxococcales bacterium]
MRPEIELLDGVACVPREAWNALVGDASPFLEWEWLASLEQAGCVGPGTGWQPKPLALRAHGELQAVCPVYVKSHSEGEFVFDWGWATPRSAPASRTTRSSSWACRSRRSAARAS